jgi:anti-anti-sigma factor
LVQQDFSVSGGTSEGCQVVAVRGDLDEVTTPLLEDTIARCRADWPLVIDLSEVEFISSAGLHAVLRERPMSVSIVAPPGNVARLFEIVRAHRRCPLFPDLDSAIREAAPAAITSP